MPPAAFSPFVGVGQRAVPQSVSTLAPGQRPPSGAYSAVVEGRRTLDQPGAEPRPGQQPAQTRREAPVLASAKGGEQIINNMERDFDLFRRGKLSESRLRERFGHYRVRQRDLSARDQERITKAFEDVADKKSTFATRMYYRRSTTATRNANRVLLRPASCGFSPRSPTAGIVVRPPGQPGGMGRVGPTRSRRRRVGQAPFVRIGG